MTGSTPHRVVEPSLAEAIVARVLKMQVHHSGRLESIPREISCQGLCIPIPNETVLQLGWDNAKTMPPNDKHPHFVSPFQAASDENTAVSGEENGVYRIGTIQRARGEAQKKGHKNSWGYLLQTGIIKVIFYECFRQGRWAEPGLGK